MAERVSWKMDFLNAGLCVHNASINGLLAGLFRNSSGFQSIKTGHSRLSEQLAVEWRLGSADKSNS